MRRTRQDQPLLRLLHVPGRDRRVRRHPHLLDDLPSQRVDQPRLSLGKAEGTLQRIHREILARLRGVLPVQLGDLGRGEVAQPQRRHLDVERTRRTKAPRIPARGRLVVTHIPQPAQHHRMREAATADSEAIAQLAQHTAQALPPQRVDLVEEQHQRTRTAPHPLSQPPREPGPWHRVGPGGGGRELITKAGGLRGPPNRLQHQQLGLTVVLPGHLPALAREVQRRVPARGRQFPGHRRQHRRLPGLPWRMHHEVLTLLDVPAGPGQPLWGRHHVVTRGDARPGRIEVAHTAHASRRHRQPEATVHPPTGHTALYGHECQSSGAPVRGSPGGQTQKRGQRPLGRGDRWSASGDRQGMQVTEAQLFACRSAHPGHVVVLIVPVGLIHPALAENLIRAGERPRRALRPVPCRAVWPRVRGRFPATTNAGKRLYLLRHGGKEWLDEDRHSRIAVETRTGPRGRRRGRSLLARCSGHGAEDCKVRCKPETAGSLHTRWLRFVASERTN